MWEQEPYLLEEMGIDRDEMDWDDLHKLALKEAKKEMMGDSLGHVMPVYVKTKNPLNLNPKGGTIFQIDFEEGQLPIP
jgi:hypothetical protein